MANTTLNMQLLLRRDQTFTSTYVLAKGEPGFEVSTNTLKVGDGTKTWAELPIANKAQIDALIKATDDKLAGYKPLQEVIAAVETSANTFVDTVAQDANGKITITTKAVDFSAADTRFKKLQNAIEAVATEKNVFIEKIAQDAQGVITITTKAVDFSAYRTAADQDAIDATLATKEALKAVTDELDTYGDIVTHNAAEFEAAGAAAAAEGRINTKLEDYYTKTQADAAFTTPAEVIEEVNKALSEVSDTDSITNITTLVNYVNNHGGDLAALVTEVYGSAEMTGDSRLDTIEAKPAMGITANDINAWNAEKGVKAIVDANKATWDKAGTALQAADLADYAKTADVNTAIQGAKDYADANDDNTTYTAAATANALEFTLTPSEGQAQTVTLVAPTVDTGIMSVEAGEDIVVTPGENGKVTIAHEIFNTGEYTKDPATSDKTGDVYMMTSVTVDNGHVTGAGVKSLAAALEGMTFVLDGGNSTNG